MQNIGTGGPERSGNTTITDTATLIAKTREMFPSLNDRYLWVFERVALYAVSLSTCTNWYQVASILTTAVHEIGGTSIVGTTWTYAFKLIENIASPDDPTVVPAAFDLQNISETLLQKNGKLYDVFKFSCLLSSYMFTTNMEIDWDIELFKQIPGFGEEKYVHKASDLWDLAKNSLIWFQTTGVAVFTRKSLAPIFWQDIKYQDLFEKQSEFSILMRGDRSTPDSLKLARIEEGIERVNAALRVCPKDVRLTLQKMANELLGWKLELEGILGGKSTRIVPFAVMFHGAAETTKSTTIAELEQVILAQNNQTPKDEKELSSLVWQKPQGSKWDDGCGPGTQVIRMDDICQTKADMMKDVNPCFDIIRYVNNNPCHLNMAEADKKSKEYWAGSLFTCTTNNKYLDATAYVTTPYAVFRRFNMIVEVVLKEEARTPEGRFNSECELARNKRHNLFRVEIATQCPVTQAVIFYQPKTVKGWMERDELFEFTKRLARHHYTVQHTIVERHKREALSVLQPFDAKQAALDKLKQMGVNMIPDVENPLKEKEEETPQLQKPAPTIAFIPDDDAVQPALASMFSMYRFFFGFWAYDIGNTFLQGTYNGLARTFTPAQFQFTYWGFKRDVRKLMAESTDELVTEARTSILNFFPTSFFGRQIIEDGVVVDFKWNIFGKFFRRVTTRSWWKPQNDFETWTLVALSALYYAANLGLDVFCPTPCPKIKEGLRGGLVAGSIYIWYNRAVRDLLVRRHAMSEMKRIAMEKPQEARDLHRGTEICKILGYTSIITVTIAASYVFLDGLRRTLACQATARAESETPLFRRIFNDWRGSMARSENVVTGALKLCSLADFDESIVKNQVEVWVTDHRGCRRCLGVLLDKHHLLTVKHLFTGHMLNDFTTVSMTLIRSVDQKTTVKYAHIEPEQCIQLPDADGVIVYLDRCFDVRPIWEKVAERKMKGVATMRYYSPIIIGDVGHTVEDCVGEIETNGYWDAKQECITVRDSKIAQQGRCGTILVNKSNDNTSAIQGFMFACSAKTQSNIRFDGTPIRHAMFVTVDRPMLVAVRDQFKEKMMDRVVMAGEDIPTRLGQTLFSNYSVDRNLRAVVNNSLCVFPIGSCSFSQTPYTRVAPRLMREEVMSAFGVEDVYGPPQFSGREDGVYFGKFRAYNTAMEHMREGAGNVKYRFLNRAYNDLLDDLGEVSQTKPLGMTATINGIPGARAVKSMPMTTSAGLPVTGPKRALFEVEDDLYVCGEKLASDFERDMRRLERGERLYPVYNALLKDEVKPKCKYKVRIFYACPVGFTLMIRKYYLPVVEELMKDFKKTGMVVGVNCASKEWENIMNFALDYKTHDEQVFGFDYSKYDLKFSPNVLRFAYKYLIEVARRMGYDKKDLEIMKILASDATKPIVNWCGTLLATTCLHASGNPLTVIVNSIVNRLLVASYVFEMLGDECKKFNDVVKMIFYGDDALGTVLRKYRAHINFLGYKSWLNGINMDITHPNKDESSSFHVLEMDFLKRLSVYHPALGHTVGALEKESIYKALLWGLKPKTHTKMIVDGHQVDVPTGNTEASVSTDVFDCALHEAALHGKEFFEDFRDKARIVCEAMGYHPTLDISYEERMAKLTPLGDPHQQQLLDDADPIEGGVDE